MLALVGPGCTEDAATAVDASTGGDDAAGSSTTGMGDEDPEDPASTGEPEDPEAPQGEPSNPPMRRLSHFELERTLEALFPTLELPPLELGGDASDNGFDNDAEAMVPSKVLIEQYSTIATDIGRLAAAQPDALVDCDLAAQGCTEQLVEDFGRRAFRRPLTERELLDFHRFFEQEPGLSDPALGVEMTVAWMLQSPQFLYRIELAPTDAGPQWALDDHQLASRLSYLLWASMPDDTLMQLADEGSLASPAALEEQARRMLADPKATSAFSHFFVQLLETERIAEQEKTDPAFDEVLAASMQEETRRFLEDIIFGEDGTLGDLLTSNRTFVDDRLAEIYGVPAPEPGTWTEVMLDPQQRAGVLTQAAFLAGHGHPVEPSPVLRGVYVLHRLGCIDFPPPPAVDEAMQPPPADAGATNRERYEAVTSPQACQSCHVMINPVGFTFEHYDTLGRWRDEDAGQPVDASGEFAGVPVNGAVELSEVLAADASIQQCFARQWLRYAYGGESAASDDALSTGIADQLGQPSTPMTELLVSIVTHERFSQGAQEGN